MPANKLGDVTLSARSIISTASELMVKVEELAAATARERDHHIRTKLARMATILADFGVQLGNVIEEL